MEVESLVKLRYYCNVTFRCVGDVGPDGTSLIDKLTPCPRCQETYYCGEEQRLEHWSIHKSVCLPARADVDVASFQDLSVSEAILELVGFFNPHWDGSSNSNLVEKDLLVGRSFRFLLEHLQKLCHKQDFASNKEEEKAASFLYRVLMNLIVANNESIESLWAIPGMTTYLMNLELVSEVMKQRKIQGLRPTAEEFEFQGFEPSFQIPKLFSNIIGFLLMASAFCDPKREASPCYRRTLLACAASRKCMQWFACPYTRVSIPSYAAFYFEDDMLGDKGLRDSQFLWILTALLRELPNDPREKTLLLPGLYVQDIYNLLTEDPVLATHTPVALLYKLVQALLHSNSTRRTAWDSFTVQSRALLAHQIVERYFSSNDDNDDPMDDKDDLCGGTVIMSVSRVECGRDLIGALTGWNTCSSSKDETLWLKVVKEAAGMNDIENDIDNVHGTSHSVEFHHTPYFQQWYAQVSQNVDPTLEEFLVNVLTLPSGGLAHELIPPAHVLQHIVEFAMEPF